MGVGDGGDVLRPIVPVVPRAAFLDELGVEGAFEIGDLELHLRLHFARGAALGLADAVLAYAGWGFAFAGGFTFGFFLHLVGDGDDLHLPLVLAVELDFVDEGIEGVVVGAERLEHVPDNLVGFVVIQRLVRLHVLRDDDGEDDVAALFPRSIPHDAADGLDDIDLRVPRGEKEHGIERGDIHALGKTADVAENAAGVFRWLCLEP